MVDVECLVGVGVSELCVEVAGDDSELDVDEAIEEPLEFDEDMGVSEPDVELDGGDDSELDVDEALETPLEFDEDADVEFVDKPVIEWVDEPVVDASLEDQVTRVSVVSATNSEITDCSILNRNGRPNLSPSSVLAIASVLVVDDPVTEAEQAVTVEHESVIVEVAAVLAPDGVKI